MRKILILLAILFITSFAFASYADFLSGVVETSPATYDFLQYNATIRAWVNQSAPTFSGDITVGDDIFLSATGKLSFDGSTPTTYMVESSDGVFDIYVDGVHFMRMTEGTSDYIEPKQEFRIGSTLMTADGGSLTFSDMQVSATPAAGAEQSYAFKIDGNTIFKPYAEADHSGGIQNKGLNIEGRLTHETYCIRKVVSLAGATDATATEIFTITTTNETGDVDGGAYSVSVHLLGTETVAAATAANASAISLTAHWTRLMLAGGTGATSAVAEISESAANDLGTGAITGITITTAETSEYVSSVLLDINTSGGTFDGYAIIELVYQSFTTPPVISD